MARKTRRVRKPELKHEIVDRAGQEVCHIWIEADDDRVDGETFRYDLLDPLADLLETLLEAGRLNWEIDMHNLHHFRTDEVSLLMGMLITVFHMMARQGKSLKVALVKPSDHMKAKLEGDHYSRRLFSIEGLPGPDPAVLDSVRAGAGQAGEKTRQEEGQAGTSPDAA